MRISSSVFLLFLCFVKICRSRDVLPVHSPEHGKKVPVQKPINDLKITFNNKKSMHPLGINLPTFQTPLVKTHNVKPRVNLHTTKVSPKLHNCINKIKKNPPNCEEEHLDHEDLKYISKSGKFETVDCNIDRVLEFEEPEDEDTLIDTIPKTIVKTNPEERYNFRTDVNKTIPENLVTKSKILNATNKNDQINNSHEFRKKIEILTNNCSKSIGTKDVNNAKIYGNDINQKSNLEVVINHDTNDDTDDPDANIIIHSDEYCEFINSAKNKVKDFKNENEQDPYTIQKIIPNYYGKFTGNQYTKTLSDEENYANIYQLPTVMEQDNKYPFYDFTQYEADILPNENNSKGKAVNDYSNVNNIWRSLKNTDVIIRNNPQNVKLVLNYGSSGNKKFNQRSFINSHSDYRNLNSLKPYYPRQARVLFLNVFVIGVTFTFLIIPTVFSVHSLTIKLAFQ